MKLFVTGEKGFIGTNLIERAKFFSEIEIVKGFGYPNSKGMFITAKGEPCVHLNEIEDWERYFSEHEVTHVVHNAAVVGTDVCALNSRESTLTNVQGTYNICRAAKALNIPVCYMGTTVIYDTDLYQEKMIKENSIRKPTTLYGCQKLASEDIIKSQTNKWMIIRPLFAYGGIGDMNSLIAKTIYASLTGETKIDMFLNPNKIKDYMHVDDYCDAVLVGLSTEECWNNDFNISVEEPRNTHEIVDIISDEVGTSLENVIYWHSETDYLGNHRLSSKKFRDITGWEHKISIKQGVEMSYKSIYNAVYNESNYNPLKHLQKAKEQNIDLTEYFHKKEV